MKKPLILLSIFSIVGYASEIEESEKVNFHEIRLSLIALPTSISSHLENKSTKKTYDATYSIDSAGELSIGYQFSHYVAPTLAVLVGANLDIIGTEDNANGVTDTTSNVGPSLHLGASLRPVDFFNMEGLVFGGFGTSEEKVKGAYSKDISSSSGSYTQVGVELRFVFTMGPGFQLFAQVGYIGLRQTLKYSRDSSINLGELEFTNKADGGTYGLGAGWRF